MPGMRMSIRTTSGESVATASTPAAPSSASPTTLERRRPRRASSTGRRARAGRRRRAARGSETVLRHACGHGSRASSTKRRRSSSMPARRRRRPAPSAPAARPGRGPCPGSRCPAAPTPSGLATSTTSESPGAPPTHTATLAVGACLPALVRASCTIAVRGAADGRRHVATASAPGRGRCERRPRAIPRRDAEQRASVGWGGSGASGPATARRRRRRQRSPTRITPITVRSSSRASCAVARITPAARAMSSGGASGRNSSAPAWTTSSDIRARARHASRGRSACAPARGPDRRAALARSRRARHAPRGSP